MRGSKATEAISFKIPSKIPSLRKFRHCEALKKPKQSLRIPYKKFKGILEFPKNSKIPRDCFASLAMTKILEFLSLVSSPDMTRGSYHEEF